ncbi:MAG: thermonuclease family protein, partial [Thermoproteota archaeon]|nr:thermonuclease family protein [Thermoproteota archaeon]
MLVSSPMIFTEIFGHQDACHRWHSCPSDNGSYVCGDKGYDSECGGIDQDDDSSDNDDNKERSNSNKNYDNDDDASLEGLVSNNDGGKSDLSTPDFNLVKSGDDVCLGTAHCFAGTVTKVVDGDTIDVDNTRIRLALANTPEINQQGYTEAKDFVSNTCGVGSKALVDEDDGQRKGSYGRMIGLVYCNDNIVSLNQILLENGHAKILENICTRS